MINKITLYDNQKIDYLLVLNHTITSEELQIANDKDLTTQECVFQEKLLELKKQVQSLDTEILEKQKKKDIFQV